MIGPIETACRTYAKLVVTKGAGATQIKETKQAFFGGAASTYTLMIGGLSSVPEPTESDLHKLRDIFDELSAFGAT